MSTLWSSEYCLSVCQLNHALPAKLTVLVEIVVQLLTKRLRVVQELESREVDRHLRKAVFPRFGCRLGQLLNSALTLPGILVDTGTVLRALEVSPRVGDRVLVLAVELRVRVRLGTEEEVQGGGLHFGVGVERGERRDGDSLCVGPHSLAPELAHHHHGPHGLTANLLALPLALVADDLGAHAALDHAEQESLDDAVQAMVLGALIRRLQIGQDRLPDRLAQVASDMREEGEKCLEEPDDVSFN